MIRWGVKWLGCVALAWAVLFGDSYAQDHSEASQAFSLSRTQTHSFGQLPILHQGRVKPLLVMADTFLGELSGQNRRIFDDSVQWFARVTFDFEKARAEPVFFVSRDVSAALSLQAQRGSLYTFNQIFEAFKAQKETILAIEKKSESARDQLETDLFQLYVLMDRFFVLGQSFEPFLRTVTLSTALQDLLQLKAREVRVVDLFEHLGRLEQMSQEALAHAQGDISAFSLLEQEIASVSFLVSQARNVAQGNDVLLVIPSKWERGDVQAQNWVSPALLRVSGHASQEAELLIETWLDMRSAYQAQDQAAFSRALEAGVRDSHALMALSPRKLSAAWLYHAYGLVNIAFALYLVSGLMFLIGRWADSTRAVGQMALLFSFIGCIVGFFVHFSALVLRSYVLMRPPVGTLYESILFVGLVCVALGLILPRWSGAVRQELGLGLALLSGICLLLLRLAFLPNGDTMGVLVAVLNTNFWLTTHVLTITIGYGLCFVVGVLGHLYLFHPQKGLYRVLVTLALVSLLFTGVGTLLGGVWADQSWGRFWGWDPKENGALVITLWLAWVLHGRLSGHFDAARFVAFLSAVTVVVALSWFGVNLLGVGLHSYGFTDGAVFGLAAFCLLEIAVIYSLYMRGRVYELY